MCLDCYAGRGTTLNGARIVTADPALRSVSAVSVANDLEIYPRSAWAGDQRPPQGELYPEEVRFLLVHHSAGPSDYTQDGAIAEMQAVYTFHTGPDRGWPDVCYNFFIDRFGRVFEARTGSLQGPVMADATGGSQGFAQLVCLLGDFTDSLPTPETLDALTRTLAWLAGRHRLELGPDAATTFVSRGSNRWPEGAEVTANTISGHRDMSQTECPGDTFYPYVTSTLRTGSAALLAVSPPPATVVGAGPTTSSVEAEAAATGADASAPSTIASPANTAVATPPPISPPSSSLGAAPQQATTQVDAEASVVTVPAGPTGNRSGISDAGVGAVAGVGVVGLAAGLGWVIKRRMENQTEDHS